MGTSIPRTFLRDHERSLSRQAGCRGRLARIQRRPRFLEPASPHGPTLRRTFEQSLRVFRRYYTPEHPLPFLMIDTWNDYEEGTAIENGTTGCNASSASTPVRNTYQAAAR